LVAFRGFGDYEGNALAVGGEFEAGQMAETEERFGVSGGRTLFSDAERKLRSAGRKEEIDR
jgi:hypothetical protein